MHEAGLEATGCRVELRRKLHLELQAPDFVVKEGAVIEAGSSLSISVAAGAW